MAKYRKKAAAPEPPIMPRVGDKVTMKGSNSVRQISTVYPASISPSAVGHLTLPDDLGLPAATECSSKAAT